MAHFDLFVIGGGSGGVACARRAASHGAVVGLAEGSRMGGTCVIRGCVPKKLMHYGAHFGEMLAAAPAYGWRFAEPALDFRALLEARNREIERLSNIYTNMLRNAGVATYAGRARLAPSRGDEVHAVEVAGERHTARNVLIAVGARPSLPEVEGIGHVVTSDFALEQVYDRPRRVAVVGAGYIGVEIASILNGLGSETTLVYRAEEPLRGFEDELRREISGGLELHGVRLRPSTVVRRIERTADDLVLHTTSGIVATDLVVYATGRQPAPQTRGIGLEEAGVRLNGEGSIYVDATYRSNVPGIYAVGDCSDHAGNGMDSGQHDLTPVAIAEGRALAERLFNDNPQTVAYDTIPTAVFGLPQAGSIGLSEARARALGMDVVIYKTRFGPMIHTLTGAQDKVFMKLIVDKADDRVIGLHMVGSEAAEIVQGFAVAMTAGATKAQFDATVALHPTVAEELVTLYQPAAS